jgi:hypothetical protein
MANFVDLLGSLMQNNLPQASDQRIGNALQGLQTHFGRMAGGQAGGGDLLGGLMGIARGVADNLSRSPAQAGGLGALLRSVLGGGTSSAKGAMAGGTLAMLAGIAFKALTEAGQSPAAGLSGDELPLGLRAPQTPAERQALESTAQLVVRGMINIAKSDGSVSVEEVQRIIGKIQTAGMDADAQEWLMAELRRSGRLHRRDPEPRGSGRGLFRLTARGRPRHPARAGLSAPVCREDRIASDRRAAHPSNARRTGLIREPTQACRERPRPVPSAAR